MFLLFCILEKGHLICSCEAGDYHGILLDIVEGKGKNLLLASLYFFPFEGFDRRRWLKYLLPIGWIYTVF